MKGSLRSRVATLAAASLMMLAPALASTPVQAAQPEVAPNHVFPINNGQGQGPTGRAGSGNITYHGGPVMLGTVHTYVIWYGSISSSTQTILSDMLRSIGGTAWYNIQTTYYNGSGTHLSNSVTLAGTTTDNYSQGKSLSDTSVKTIVSNAISSGRLPKDTNGVYFVLTAGDVAETSGFLTQYCGWHDHASISGSDIKYSFVGDPSKNYSACSQYSLTPNGNRSADAMASVIAHELVEAASDPDLNAWYDSAGYENADKCAWTWGATYTAPNGAVANVHWGSRDYLIQQNWKAGSSQGCALHL